MNRKSLGTSATAAPSQAQPASKGQPLARLVRRCDLDRTFDVEFWQAQDTAARWQAAWDLARHSIERTYAKAGKIPEVDAFRLQRTVERLQRQRR